MNEGNNKFNWRCHRFIGLKYPAKAVYKLVSLILNNQSGDVGIEPQESSKSFFDNYWEKNFNDKNE